MTDPDTSPPGDENLRPHEEPGEENREENGAWLQDVAFPDSSPASEQDAWSSPGRSGERVATAESGYVREHLRGLLEAVLFLSSEPISTLRLCRLANAERGVVAELIQELRGWYETRGVQLDEIGGGWIFRTNPAYAPFLRELTGQKPTKLTRAQLETLAIVAYRQPVTRPEIDDVRGVDSGPVLKVLLDRELIAILGKKEEAGRPLLYGTTPQFLAFFNLASLRDLPTLKEFSELTDESKSVFTDQLGEAPPSSSLSADSMDGLAGAEGYVRAMDTTPAARSNEPEEATENALARAAARMPDEGGEDGGNDEGNDAEDRPDDKEEKVEEDANHESDRSSSTTEASGEMDLGGGAR